jgi:hypothetical protein
VNKVVPTFIDDIGRFEVDGTMRLSTPFLAIIKLNGSITPNPFWILLNVCHTARSLSIKKCSVIYYDDLMNDKERAVWHTLSKIQKGLGVILPFNLIVGTTLFTSILS